MKKNKKNTLRSKLNRKPRTWRWTTMTHLPRLAHDRERQAYTILKCQDFGHTKAFDTDLLEKTSMDVDFARIWHAVQWDGFCPLRRMVLVSSPSMFFASFER
jgi:hypothetical protein